MTACAPCWPMTWCCGQTMMTWAAHMERIAARLSALGASALHMVHWGAAPAHGDAYDYFAADGTADGVEESVSVWTPTAQPNAPKHATSYSYAWNDAGNAQRLLDAGGRERLLYRSEERRVGKEGRSRWSR